jgi:hypothetical protein
MRLRELLESKFFNELDYVKQGEKGREIDYELEDDLIFFMNNHDQAYRRFLHPVINKCIQANKHKKKYNSNIFEHAVTESYKLYVKAYPIRELPDQLNEDEIKQICKKLSEEVYQHIADGKYKD